MTNYILAKLDKYGIKVVQAVKYEIEDDSREWAEG